jgi:signal transduction histidine kinase
VEELKSKAIYENIENDRKRISRDLHDGLGQILTSAKLKLETFQLSKSIDDKQFSGSLDLIKNTGQTLRKIVHNLHPLEIEKYGLAVSIEMMCNEMNNDSPIKIVSQISNYSRRLSKKNEVMVFRIVQEALNNAIRHSNAKEINLIFWESIGNLHITIIDDGCGFDLADKLDAKIKGRHFGLVNINQRANFIGADLVISSKINLGTTIKLEVPFNE